MYPNRELKDLARLRGARIRSIEHRRWENSESVRRGAQTLRLGDWAVAQWRATRLPADLAMVPVTLLLHRINQPRAQCVRRSLRCALVVLALARQLDQIGDVEPARAQ